ncbi:helix-turn-helix domain-containing protein [Arsenophonus nasoniae]|uniref:Helix-turn-helix domain-containing protein n=1 Tax=Arsenophonus nasoniae TaxID=638 RepID=A0AA95K7Z9_9GAMM|nr:helix-turn-helix domain-containing protein [Arsenophonus nasoniae]WGM03845.1 helix-turn-helix domain-containing protein [Arsenophonus nasoniae]
MKQEILVNDDVTRTARKQDLKNESEIDNDRLNEENKNNNFTQTYPKGWRRIRELSRKNAGSVALYSFLAEHIDHTCGAVVADQTFLASKLCVSVRTIQRWLDFLEEERALVRIPVAGKVCAYALNPHEVWKGYNTAKEYAAFVTKTLVNKNGEIQRRIKSMFSSKDE